MNDTTSHNEVLAAVRATKAQVVVLDVDRSASGEGVHLIGPLSDAGLKVIALTTDPDRGSWGECLHRGADAVMTPTRTLEGLTTTIDRVSAGLPGMNAAVRHEHLRAFHSSHGISDRTQARRLMASLSPREREILGHLMRGATVAEIAADGVVSEATVRTQVKSILIKLEVSSQLAAIAVPRRAAGNPTRWSRPRDDLAANRGSGTETARRHPAEGSHCGAIVVEKRLRHSPPIDVRTPDWLVHAAGGALLVMRLIAASDSCMSRSGIPQGDRRSRCGVRGAPVRAVRHLPKTGIVPQCRR